MTYTVYMLRTNKNTLYVGQTNNLEKRLKEHRDKTAKASKYLKAFSSFSLVYTEELATRSEAMRREIALKKLTHAQKETLISNSKKLLTPNKINL